VSWQFSQTRGTITSAAGAVIGTGYSGHGPGVDNPAMQTVRNVGPLPVGHYTFGELIPTDPKLGEYVIPLIPDPSNQMYGRSGFFWHGDNSAHNESASEGCIVSAFTTRQEAYESADHSLEVVA